MKHFVFPVLLFSLLIAEPADLQKGRALFYKAMDDEKLLTSAEKYFTDLMNQQPQMKGKSLVYLGTLRAVRAKYAFWPMTKLSLVNEAFPMMDSGIAFNPDDVESLFIYGMTCFNLPVFFDRHDDAEKVFKKSAALLHQQAALYDEDLFKNMVKFFYEQKIITDAEKTRLNKKRFG